MNKSIIPKYWYTGTIVAFSMFHRPSPWLCKRITFIALFLSHIYRAQRVTKVQNTKINAKSIRLLPLCADDSYRRGAGGPAGRGRMVLGFFFQLVQQSTFLFNYVSCHSVLTWYNLTTAAISSRFSPQLGFCVVLFYPILSIKWIALRWLSFPSLIRLFIKLNLQDKNVSSNARWNIWLLSLLPYFNTMEDMST